ncbi:MAG TPA: hypothetical protein VLK34_05345 [Nocardioidaceae bacterium]|nr:hypothetical protein [Nocardioidaceae bacterium]
MSGTPPEEMLQVPTVVQVAGDDKRRIFRRADALRREVPPDDDGRVLEGYHWGNLTSGSWRQSLWLLLIPFGMINAAQFMLPGVLAVGSDPRTGLPAPSTSRGVGPGRSRATRITQTVCGAALRYLALCLTCLLALTTAFITVDLFGVRKANDLAVSDPWKDGGFAALGLIAAGLLIFFLYWVGGRSKVFGAESKHNPHLGEQVSGLARWSFLNGDPSAPALRRLHLSAGLAMAMIPGAVTVHDAHNSFADSLLLYGASSVLVGVTIVVVFMGDLEESASLDIDPTGRTAWVRRGVRRVALFASWLGLALTLAGIALEAYLLAFERFDPRRTDVGQPPSHGARPHYPALAGVDRASFTLLTVTAGCMAVVVAANVVMALLTKSMRPRFVGRYFTRYAFGLASSMCACMAVFVALGFSGAASFLAGKATHVDPTHFPQILERIAYAWGVTALLGVLLVLVMLLSMARRAVLEPSRAYAQTWKLFSTGDLRARARVAFSTGLPDAPYRVDITRWEKRVASAMWKARLKNKIAVIAVMWVAAGAVMSAVAYSESRCQWTGRYFWSAGHFDQSQQCSLATKDFDHWPGDTLAWIYRNLSQTNRAATVLASIGTAALVLLAGALVSAGRAAVKSQSKRRVLTIIWDVIAFWPHACHPFAPPPYSQAAVLHFRDRIRWHLYDGQPPVVTLVEQPDENLVTRLFRAVGILPARHLPGVAERRSRGEPRTPVVVSAHSQGSLIALASLMWLNDEERRCVGLVTYGSQLQLLFPRGFAQHVNYELLRTVLDDGPLGSRWINLYRETDPIAGPVLSWRHGKPDSTTTMRSCSFRPSDDSGPGYEPPEQPLDAAWIPARDRVMPDSGRGVGTGRRARDDAAGAIAAVGGADGVASSGVKGVEGPGGAEGLWRSCDWRLLDPPPAPGDDVTEQTGPVNVIRGHSNFFADPEYPRAVAAVRARQQAAGPD